MKIPRAVRVSFKIVLGISILGIAGITVLIVLLSSQLPESVTLPKPGGPYAVGRRFFDWVDRKRIDPFAPVSGIPRELTVWVWYPAVSASDPAAEYLPEVIREALVQQANPVIASVARWLTVDQANAHSHAVESPTLPAHPLLFPVVLMKPGYGALALQYSALAEDLASHGYVVLGSDSPHTTPVVVYEDGRVAFRTPAGHPPEGREGTRSKLAPGQPNDLMLPVARVWVDDLRFMLDRLQEINAAGSSQGFAGRLDLHSVGAFGHSFGGSASLQFCKDDARCTAAIDIDGALWGDIALGGLTKPALFFLSDRPILRSPASELSPDAATLLNAIARIRAGLPNHPNLMVLSGSNHYNFTDSALLTEPHFARFVGMIGPIDQLRALAVTRRYVLAFFDTFLKGKPDELLQGPSQDFPEVRIE